MFDVNNLIENFSHLLYFVKISTLKSIPDGLYDNVNKKKYSSQTFPCHELKRMYHIIDKNLIRDTSFL